MNLGVNVNSKDKSEDLVNSGVSEDSNDGSEAPDLLESGDSNVTKFEASKGSNFDYEFTEEAVFLKNTEKLYELYVTSTIYLLSQSWKKE